MGAVTLRKIHEADAPRLVKWRNENAQWFPRQKPFTVTSHLDWYYGTYLKSPSLNQYIVIRKDLDRDIGVVGMTIRHGSGELGNMILGDKSSARGGYMREAVMLLMDAYGLDRYWLHTMPGNYPVQRFYGKLGFRITSTRGPKFTAADGTVKEYVVMARTGNARWDEVMHDPAF